VLNRAALVLAFAGIFVAGVLSLGPLLNVAIPCGPGGGCDVVASHPSSRLMGVPIAYLGFLAYVALAALAAIRSATGTERARPLVMAGLAISGIGAIVSIGLTIYSFTVIQAKCEWCIASAVIMVLLTLVHAGLAQSDLSRLVPNSLDTKLLAGLGLAALLGLVWQGFQMEERGTKVPHEQEVLQSMPMAELAPPDAHSLGEDTAPITIVEFADLTCKHCKDVYPYVKELVRGSNGKIRVVFRHLPWFEGGANPVTLPAAMASEYAGEKGRFWQFMDVIYGKPAPLSGPEEVLDMLSSLNLDAEAFRERIANANDPIVQRVQRDRATADRLGLVMTPTFIIATKEHGREVANNNTLPRILGGERYKKLLGRE